MPQEIMTFWGVRINVSPKMFIVEHLVFKDSERGHPVGWVGDVDKDSFDANRTGILITANRIRTFVCRTRSPKTVWNPGRTHAPCGIANVDWWSPRTRVRPCYRFRFLYQLGGVSLQRYDGGGVLPVSLEISVRLGLFPGRQ